MTDKEVNEIVVELGKRQGQIILDYESLPKIHGWMARDPDGLWFYYRKPERDEEGYLLNWPGRFIEIDDVMPEIKETDEPVRVELLIRKV